MLCCFDCMSITGRRLSWLMGLRWFILTEARALPSVSPVCDPPDTMARLPETENSVHDYNIRFAVKQNEWAERNFDISLTCGVLRGADWRTVRRRAAAAVKRGHGRQSPVHVCGQHGVRRVILDEKTKGAVSPRWGGGSKVHRCRLPVFLR